MHLLYGYLVTHNTVFVFLINMRTWCENDFISTTNIWYWI